MSKETPNISKLIADACRGELLVREQDHEIDADCAIFLIDDMCTECGVDHSGECAWCGGRGFHALDCPEITEVV